MIQPGKIKFVKGDLDVSLHGCNNKIYFTIYNKIGINDIIKKCFRQCKHIKL